MSPLEAAAVVAELVRRLPERDALRLADLVSRGQGALAASSSTLASPRLRRAARDLLLLLEDGHEAAFVAGALHGAVAMSRTAEAPPDLVWSGPQMPDGAVRLTPGVIVELLDSAEKDVLLVGYAVHDEPRVTDALHRAAARGVALTLLLERAADNPQYRGHGTPFAGLPARRLCWPGAQRPAGASLHAKLLVVDGRAALIGSANVTGAALDRNLECGVLLRGEAARRLQRHVAVLAEAGEIVPVT